MRLLVTGGAGFIGSHLILCWNASRPDDKIFNIDRLNYAADRRFESELSYPNAYEFRRVDLIDQAALEQAIQDFSPDAVIHLAAESHVDNSIDTPEAFLQANVIGTFRLLEALRKHWHVSKTSHASDLAWHQRLHHVSTDEVFGSLSTQGLFDETTAYAPQSPYAATKAASDHLVRAYGNTYGLNYTISTSSNNFGPRQHAEKLIPTVVRRALANEPIPVYGDGCNVRDWIFVTDHCDAIQTILLHGDSGATYCVGAGNELSNIEIVRMICEVLDELAPDLRPPSGYAELIFFVADRPGHDFRYAINATRIQTELGWAPATEFGSALRSTVRSFINGLS